MAVATTPHINARLLVRLYYQLTKPGIVYSNVMTAVAGYVFASRWHVQVPVLFGLAAGTGLIIAASCVLNNYIDRKIDSRMRRTSKRALVTKQISARAAIVYAVLLGAAGFGLLTLTNWLTLLVGVGAVFSYVVLYGVAKRRSVHGTLVGTVPGAAALVAGYAAATNRLDVGALLLFMVMLTWQMAHFYAIAIYRRDDYAAAGVPVRAVSKGVANTRRHIIAYMALYAAAIVGLSVFGYEGLAFAVIMTLVSVWWFYGGVQGLTQVDETKWARTTFLRSLIVLLLFSAMLPLGVLLP